MGMEDGALSNANQEAARSNLTPPAQLVRLLRRTIGVKGYPALRNRSRRKPTRTGNGAAAGTRRTCAQTRRRCALGGHNRSPAHAESRRHRKQSEPKGTKVRELGRIGGSRRSSSRVNSRRVHARARAPAPTKPHKVAKHRHKKHSTHRPTSTHCRHVRHVALCG